MAETPNNKPQNSTDEIDLGQLFQMIGNGFRNLFNGFLRFFLFLKRNALLLMGLLVVGAALGYGLKQLMTKKMKTEVIVKPQMDSKNYLYDVVAEIQANIRARDTLFFNSLGIDDVVFDGLEVSVARVQEEGGSKTDLEYLELLQDFENTEAIADIVRAELQNKSSFNHRITFLYSNAAFGEVFATKVMAYINTNEYFDGLISIYRENAQERIKANEHLLAQVDDIIKNYSNELARTDNTTATDKIVLDNQERLDITGLFKLKNDLIRDIESKKLELENVSEPIKIINFGQPHPIQKARFENTVLLVPAILLGLFFLFVLLRYLNQKAQEIPS
ncbi:hypothetical protein [Maribacter sp. 2307ULW6-5]|uniref:hypothetical protein n=1 Tax=Maribacter sp. 2307ULW6-5 TaxID=3386275 RepID=UPI0039BD8581